MKGRIPKATPLRLLEGNREHRTIHAELEPKPDSGKPPRPKFLGPAARKHWRYLLKHLESMGTLAASDQGSIMAACEIWGEIVEAKEYLDSQKYLPPAQRDLKLELAHLRGLRAAMRDLVSFEANLGLNPTARTRIKLDKPQSQSRKEALLS